MVKMTTVYLHIGTHKTGTSSIQKFLFDNQNALKELGFLYPLTGRDGKIDSDGKCEINGNYQLALELLKDDKRARYRNWLQHHKHVKGSWKKLVSEIDESRLKNVIVTSEDLSFLKPEQMSAIADYLSGYEVKIIVYLRNQYAYLKSLYAQDIKTGCESKSFKTYLEKMKYLGFYDERIEPWANIFKKDSLIVKSYDAAKNNLIQDFLRSINCVKGENNWLSKTKTANVSPSIKFVKTLRWLNVIAKDLLGLSEEECRRLYLNKILYGEGKLSAFNKVVARIPNFMVGEELLSQKDRINLIREFDSSNKKLFELYRIEFRESGINSQPLRSFRQFSESSIDGNF